MALEGVLLRELPPAHVAGEADPEVGGLGVEEHRVPGAEVPAAVAALVSLPWKKKEKVVVVEAVVVVVVIVVVERTSLTLVLGLEVDLEVGPVLVDLAAEVALVPGRRVGRVGVALVQAEFAGLET